MTTKTVQVNDEIEFRKLLELAENGTEVVFVKGAKEVARLLPFSSSPRVAGLHKGVAELSADFSDPLPDDFWAASR